MSAIVREIMAGEHWSEKYAERNDVKGEAQEAGKRYSAEAETGLTEGLSDDTLNAVNRALEMRQKGESLSRIYAETDIVIRNNGDMDLGIGGPSVWREHDGEEKAELPTADGESGPRNDDSDVRQAGAYGRRLGRNESQSKRSDADAQRSSGTEETGTRATEWGGLTPKVKSELAEFVKSGITEEGVRVAGGMSGVDRLVEKIYNLYLDNPVLAEQYADLFESFESIENAMESAKNTKEAPDEGASSASEGRYSVEADALFPRNRRSQSAFMRSFVNKTNGLKPGEHRSIIIYTGDDLYLVDAKGSEFEEPFEGDIHAVVDLNAVDPTVSSQIAKRWVHRGGEGLDGAGDLSRRYDEALRHGPSGVHRSDAGILSGASGATDEAVSLGEAGRLQRELSENGEQDLRDMLESALAGAVIYDGNGHHFIVTEAPDEGASSASEGRYSVEIPYAPTFCSKMAKTVDEIRQPKLGAASVVSYLRGRGVKAESSAQPTEPGRNGSRNKLR